MIGPHLAARGRASWSAKAMVMQGRVAKDAAKARLEAKRSRKGTTFEMLTRVVEFLKGAIE